MTDILGPLMFVGALMLIFTGYPVAFSLAGTGLLFAVIGGALGEFDWILFSALPNRIFGIMSNYVLLAIPFFILMGTVLQRSGLAEDLLETFGMLFGRLRGGLAIGVILVGTMLAAATGVVGATVVSMGMISLPIMLRYGYSPALSTGVIAASGTLGQVIPPSVVLIVLGDQLGVSVGNLFLGSLVPGLFLSGMYLLYVIAMAIFQPNSAPALPDEVLDISKAQLALRIFRVMLPPLALILIVLGSIFAGVATPTEAGAMGVIGALVLAALNRRLTLKTLIQALDSTVELTTMVIVLLLGATLFSLVFRGVGGDAAVEHLLTNLPGGVVSFLVFVNLLVFFLGFFLDYFEIVFIIVPLMAPIALNFGFDLVWFGVMLGVNLQTSFLTPPFGFSLFYLRGVAPPDIPTTSIYRGVVPFICIQVVGLLLLIVFPQIVTWASLG
ncbi:TRAP transporter large permease [Leptolyngbya iicbica]|uniref:TRAP transporter large permease subunit n=2 Tax=Cyanophyceae TaxID=3028117 RepID=A0A4V2E1Y8_9CYAN|nr:TRAP transporter large permease subunit [Leptolyngbya sp. LK]RZM76001.1 TRAP transporter large permease subunit [Leptolyngbya sp. LK]